MPCFSGAALTIAMSYVHAHTVWFCMRPCLTACDRSGRCFDAIDAAYDVAISGDPVTALYTWTYAYEKDASIDTSLNSYESASSSSSSSSSNGWGGNRPGNQGPGGAQEGNSKSTTYSCKGIKANNLIAISGGTLYITVSGSDVDGIDSNGTYTAMSGDEVLFTFLIGGTSSYSKLFIASELLTAGTSYSLVRDETTVTS